MFQLSSIKEKLSWRLVLVLALYVAAAVSFAALLLPLWMKTRGMQGELAQVTQTEQQLVRLLEQRSELEVRLREVREGVANLARQVPSQYDLQAALQGIRGLADVYNLSVESLNSSPLQAQDGGQVGVVPLTLDLQGGGQVLDYVLKLQEVFPSLSLAEVGLAYLGSGEFGVALRGELQVVLVDAAENSAFKVPELSAVELAELPVQAFGLPLNLVARFLQGQVEVLGIVDAGRDKAALIAQGGEGSWLRIGDSLDGAVITDISSGSVLLDLDGVQLKLTIGG